MLPAQLHIVQGSDVRYILALDTPAAAPVMLDHIENGVHYIWNRLDRVVYSYCQLPACNLEYGMAPIQSAVYHNSIEWHDPVCLAKLRIDT